MFFKKVEIEGYLPFTHIGNKHVEFDVDQPCTCFLGTNGSGKSSLLRAMSVMPATRTSYEKNGFVNQTIEHDGHIYELSSNFSSSTAPNSFKKDGVELNISGTGDTQNDLIKEYFGYTPAIHELMAGELQICSMAKAARKQFFSSFYPSDLSFVLEYHKKVCSQIRAFGSQIKLLQQREGALTSSLIDTSERERLERLHCAGLEIIDRIDKVNLLLENEIERLQNHELLKQPFQKVDAEATIDYVNRLHDKYVRNFLDADKTRYLGETISIEALKEKYVELSNELKFVTSSKQQIEDNLQTLRDELNKFTGLKNASVDDKKDELTREAHVIRTEMTELENGDKGALNTPVIPMDKLVVVLEELERISVITAELHNYAGSLIGGEKLSALRSENDNLKFSIKTLLNERVAHDKALSQAKIRKESLTKNSYPPDCVRICSLRATLESSIKDCDLRISQLTSRMNEIDALVNSSESTIRDNEKVIQAATPAFPLMKELHDILAENFLLETALKGESFVDCLNDHAGEIANRLIYAVDASKKYYRYKELKDRFTAISDTLNMMETAESAKMSAAVIESIINDKEKQLEDGIKKLASLEIKSDEIVSHIDQIGEVGSILKQLTDTISHTKRNLNIEFIMSRIDFDRKIIREHTGIKNGLSIKLREIEATLADQKRTIDILNSEIKPTLADLKRQLGNWMTVESGLNPASGLPCIYLVRFINKLISRANAFIKKVWCYDLELVYLKEDEDLDFTLEVLVNKSTIVKDISICSDGMKAIINLAMTLAIAEERGFLNWAPIRCDEVDRMLSENHRAKLVDVLSEMLETGVIKQMFLVNHYAIQTGLTMCDVICLSTQDIVVPNKYNEHAQIW